MPRWQQHSLEIHRIGIDMNCTDSQRQRLALRYDGIGNGTALNRNGNEKHRPATAMLGED